MDITTAVGHKEMFQKESGKEIQEQWKFTLGDYSESLYQECKKIFNSTIIEKLQGSERYSYWKGDIIITSPHKSIVVLNTISVRKYKKDGITAAYLWNKNKYEQFSEMINIDVNTGTKHFIAYANKRLSKKDKVLKDWFVAPLDQNMAVLKELNKKYIKPSDLTGVLPLSEMVKKKGLLNENGEYYENM